MAHILDATEVAKHNTSESCWIILYKQVYDVTEFLPNHPGGSKIILQYAGRDATDAYDPVHPPGTLEESLPSEARLGALNPGTIPRPDDPLVKNTPTTELERTPLLDDLLNLDELEEVATKRLSTKTWAYYYSGGDDLISKRLNSDVYKSMLLRPRIFIDCERCDTSTTLLGHEVKLPIYVSPAAMARLAHPAGEHGIAQACGKYGVMQLISHNASMTPEQIVEDSAPGQVFGWQLYAQTEKKKSEDKLARINKLKNKIKLICLTLDAPVPGKREHDERASNLSSNLPVTSGVQDGSSSKTAPSAQTKRAGIAAQMYVGTSPNLTWKKTLPWLAKHTSMPILLKGIQTHEDAYIASLHAPQIKGIILSNHGGRAADTAPPSIHTLLEIRKYCPEVFNRIEVWVDGGIKRGTDVVKALCLGAKGVGIGRAALWGLGAGGPEGVERTLEILKAEIETCMRLLGARTVSELGPQHINTRTLEQQIYDGPAGLEKIDLWVKSML